MYKHFPQLVEKCDLEHILHELIEKDELSKEILNEISLVSLLVLIFNQLDFALQEDNLRHNNRCILFKLINLEQFNAFPGFVEALKQNGFNELVSSLENNYKRITKGEYQSFLICVFIYIFLDNQLHPLDVNIDVKLSTQFYDTNEYNRTGFYTTRSKNRGHVLLVNNIKFPAGNEERHGAETDQENLRTLFEKMGLTVFSFTNLSAYEMYFKTQEFSKNVPETKPDMAIVIFMSHGLMYQNETMIISSDNKMLTEDSFRTIFNNENCALFRGKPKIFIYHICRTVLENPMRETMTDANRSDTQRTYSDMLICHPSVKGGESEVIVQKCKLSDCRLLCI